MEQLFEIPGHEGFTITGRQRMGASPPARASSGQAIIVAHGLTHDAGQLLPQTCSDAFVPAGYDIITFDFYGRKPECRRQDQGTLTSQVADLLHVIRHFQNTYTSIDLIGHSMGGLTVVLAAEQFNEIPCIRKLCLWDPSLDIPGFWNALIPIFEKKGSWLLKEEKKSGLFHLNYGTTYLLNPEMIREIYDLPGHKCLERVKAIHHPAMIATGGEESIFDFQDPCDDGDYSPEAFQKNWGGPCHLVKIDKANHTFTNQGNRQALFKATLAFLER